jgi:hypothetical protein
VATAVCLDHRRHERGEHVDRAHQVDVDGALPVLGGEVLDASPGGDAGDVHDHVDRTGQLVGAGREGVDGVDVADVEGLVMHDRAAGLADQPRGFRQGVRRDVGEHQAGALRGGEQRGRPADATAGPGDDGRRAVELRPRHDASSEVGQMYQFGTSLRMGV